MHVGIDAISFSTSRYVIPLIDLAKARNIDYEKFSIGIEQTHMSVFPPNEDIVTIAVDASEKVLKYIDKEEIDLVIFASESSFDISKSAGIYVHHFLGLKDSCRVFDVKQACYSLTAALQMAKTYVQCNNQSKVLIIGSDILRYAPGSTGEPTQGGAAVAIIVSQNPRIMYLENHHGIYTTDIMDFWRPAGSKQALFDGRLSAHNYLRSLEIAFEDYLKNSGLNKSDIDHVCFHAPFSKMAKKACLRILPEKNVENTLIYNSIIGNSCSASLYICLLSLLDNSTEDLTSKRIGLFSYGSGSVAEFFSGIILADYKRMLSPENNLFNLENRTTLSFEEYEHFFDEQYLSNKSYNNVGRVYLDTIINGKRIYKTKQ